MVREYGSFIWDRRKELINAHKHHIDFVTAAKTFEDPDRRIFFDSKHNDQEERYFCIGKVAGKVVTVRFVYRGGKIRIIGAGFWRKGMRYYENK